MSIHQIKIQDLISYIRLHSGLTEKRLRASFNRDVSFSLRKLVRVGMIEIRRVDGAKSYFVKEN